MKSTQNLWFSNNFMREKKFICLNSLDIRSQIWRRSWGIEVEHMLKMGPAVFAKITDKSSNENKKALKSILS